VIRNPWPTINKSTSHPTFQLKIELRYLGVIEHIFYEIVVLGLCAFNGPGTGYNIALFVVGAAFDDEAVLCHEAFVLVLLLIGIREGDAIIAHLVEAIEQAIEVGEEEENSNDQDAAYNRQPISTAANTYAQCSG